MWIGREYFIRLHKLLYYIYLLLLFYIYLYFYNYRTVCYNFLIYPNSSSELIGIVQIRF